MIFEPEQINELLESDNSHFRKIAKKNIVDFFHIYSDLFFDIFSQNPYDIDLIQYICQRFPVLLDGSDEPMPIDFSKKYYYFEDHATGYKLFLEKLDGYFNNMQSEDDKKQFLFNLYKIFEGLHVDLKKMYPDHDFPISFEDKVQKQLMVFITGKCNLQCPYCFSNELQPTEMSLSDFEEILKWASQNKVTRISLCGGEPTFHSRFGEILTLITRYGIKAYFASNFTIDCTSWQFFNSTVIDQIFIHLTDKTIDNTHLKNCMKKNIHHAKQQGIRLVYRTNISNKTPRIDEWFQIIKETDMYGLNIALTFPTQHSKNQFIDTALFDEYTDVIRKIMDEANKLKIELSFAKPIPLCIFDKKTQDNLLSRRNFHPICGVHYNNYTNNICISPEMTFHACLGVTNKSLKFKKDLSWKEIEVFCADTIRPLINKPLFDKCNSCFLFDRKLCQGSCLSYKTIL